jgi:hypothetical protein
MQWKEALIGLVWEYFWIIVPAFLFGAFAVYFITRAVKLGSSGPRCKAQNWVLHLPQMHYPIFCFRVFDD